MAVKLANAFGANVVTVDGGNRFDPYEIGKAARALGGDGKEALSRIHVSRAFTCHQMEAFLSQRLPGALSRFDARLALIMGLPETFSDADVPYAEACRVFRNCLSALRRVALAGTRVILVGRGEPPAKNHYSVGSVPGNRSGFFRYLVRTAEPVLLLQRREEGWVWELRREEARLARGGS